jgi:hypothetical protein
MRPGGKGHTMAGTVQCPACPATSATATWGGPAISDSDTYGTGLVNVATP